MTATNLLLPSRWLGALIVLASIGTAAVACQVPVFRYALERWPPDRYELIVMHESVLSADEKKLLEKLTTQTIGPASNASVRVVQVDQSEDATVRRLWSQHGSDGNPIVAVLYPRSAQEVPDRLVEVVSLNDESLACLADSPVRQTILKRLLDGHSAIWLFVPIGDPEQDKAALNTLRAEVQRNQDSLELPEQEDGENDATLLAGVDIELRLEFSIVTLDRDDPSEKHLLKMLLASEPDLMDLKQPMAFPVLGRGRVLYALIGNGIADNTIGIASRFMIGPCSCQVKNLNPGFDLLMQCDWAAEVGTEDLSQEIAEEATTPEFLTIPPGRKK